MGQFEHLFIQDEYVGIHNSTDNRENEQNQNATQLIPPSLEGSFQRPDTIFVRPAEAPCSDVNVKENEEATTVIASPSQTSQVPNGDTGYVWRRGTRKEQHSRDELWKSLS